MTRRGMTIGVLMMMAITQAIGQTDARSADSTRLEWFRKAKFGIFLHWGVYSGNTTESWAFFNGEISHRDYMANGKTFTGSKFDPDRWAQLFKNAGARYAVLTAMHTDGVTLFNSKHALYRLKDIAPYKDDPVVSYTKAMHREGIKAGLYYSHVDWSDDDYMMLTQGLSKKELAEKRKVKYNYAEVWNKRNKDGAFGRKKFAAGEQEMWTRFLNKHDDRIEELLTGYDKIDLVWFDFMYPDVGDFEWNEEKLKMKMLEKNPALVVNGRLGKSGDYFTAERGFPVVTPPGVWEFCETISDNWGYLPNDTIFKSSRQLVRMLVECIGMGGNLLLAIGPKPDGTFDPEHEKRLLAIGEWIKKHEEAVYETKRGLLPGHFHGPTAIAPDNKTIYLYLLDDPKEEIHLKGVRNKVRNVSVVGHPQQSLNHRRLGGAPWANIPGAIVIKVPHDLLDDNVTVIKVEFDSPLNLYREKGKDIILN